MPMRNSIRIYTLMWPNLCFIDRFYSIFSDPLHVISVDTYADDRWLPITDYPRMWLVIINHCLVNFILSIQYLKMLTHWYEQNFEHYLLKWVNPWWKIPPLFFPPFHENLSVLEANEAFDALNLSIADFQQWYLEKSSFKVFEILRSEVMRAKKLIFIPSAPLQKNPDYWVTENFI